MWRWSSSEKLNINPIRPSWQVKNLGISHCCRFAKIKCISKSELISSELGYQESHCSIAGAVSLMPRSSLSALPCISWKRCWTSFRSAFLSPLSLRTRFCIFNWTICCHLCLDYLLKGVNWPMSYRHTGENSYAFSHQAVEHSLKIKQGAWQTDILLGLLLCR